MVGKFINKFLKTYFFLLIWGLLFLVIFFFKKLDFPKSGNESLRIYDRNGELIYEILSDDDKQREDIGLEMLNPFIEGAFVSIEDERFFKHFGFDPLSILRALYVDLRSFKIKEGGSTITQQCIKLLTNRKSKNIFAKFYEILLAVKLEFYKSKKEILTLYLNNIPFGGNIVGIRKASKVYFNTEVGNLTIAQIAYLAAIPKLPSYYDPYKNHERTLNRQKFILKKMKKMGYINEEDLIEALNEKITVEKNIKPFKAPHFVERVKEIYKGKKGNSIKTTLDLKVQEIVEKVIDFKRDELKKIGAKNVAVIVIDNSENSIVAYEGSSKYFEDVDGGKIDGVRIKRQPGSALKPFLYLLAFDMGYKPSTLLPDVPLSFTTYKEGSIYFPRNYDEKFRGPLSIRLALGNSINVPAVYLLSKIGINNFINFLKEAGITTIDKSSDYYGYGVALGNLEVRLDELSNLYASLSRGGILKKLKMDEDEFDSSEKIISSFEAAYFITDILSDKKAREISFGRNSPLDFPFKVACKTGTSEGYHDNFAFGYDKYITVGVWVGNFDRKPLKNSSGISGAGPIFHEIFQNVRFYLAKKKIFYDDEILLKQPHLKKIKLCALSGLKYTDSCPSYVFDYADENLKDCDWHIKEGKQIITYYPEIYGRWLKEMHLLDGSRRIKSNFDILRIIYPQNGQIFLYDPTLKKEYQGIFLEAEGGGEKLKWFVDGHFWKEVKKSEKVFYKLEKGSHMIEVKDEKGNRACSKIIVR